MVKIKDIHVILTAPEGINLMIVKIDTDTDGLYGLGCATFAYRILAVKSVVEKYLKPLLVGQAVENIEQIWMLMHQNAYWRNGPIENSAISGIDMALWDIKGKMANMPLYQIFGGKHREGVPIYRHADGHSFSELCENIAKYQEEGVTHIRCQCGGYGGDGYQKAPKNAPKNAPDGVYLDPSKYMKNTIALFAKLRDTVGYEIEFCHDVHERLKPDQAIWFAKELEPFRLFFLEDAIPLEEMEWLRLLRQKTVTPLAQGELLSNPYEWRILITERLVDFIRIHMSQIGGITPARKVQILAEEFGVRTAWHGPGDMSPLAHAANVHLDLASYNLGIQEWSGTNPPNFVIQELKGPKDALLEVFPGLPEYKNGYVYVKDTPGLGVDINEHEAAKYPCDHSVTTWTQTRLPDGTLQKP